MTIDNEKVQEFEVGQLCVCVSDQVGLHKGDIYFVKKIVNCQFNILLIEITSHYDNTIDLFDIRFYDSSFFRPCRRTNLTEFIKRLNPNEPLVEVVDLKKFDGMI